MAATIKSDNGKRRGKAGAVRIDTVDARGRLKARLEPCWARITAGCHGQDRKITLPPATAAFFAEQCKGKLPTAPLLARADGSAWNKDAWKYPFKDAVIAAELPAAATACALRHPTITDLIALHKLDTLTVAQLSGTSLLMIEKHYGHLLREHAAKALASLTL